ncbi:MAG: PEGA domain-containing protein [Candidatus Acidiferrales bacterium]
MRLGGGMILVALVVVLGSLSEGGAQVSPARKQEMQGALAERYRLTLIGEGALGFTGDRGSIRRAGNMVLLRREGLEGSLDPDRPASYAIRGDQTEHYRGKKDVALPVGENLYVHSIQVGSDVVTLGMLTSRRASSPSGPQPLWVALSFFLPPEVIAQGNMNAVYAALDHWLQPQGAFQPSLSPPMVDEVQSSPADLKPGMTKEEVVAALGPARREVSFGQRTWLHYGSLVAVLEGGRLTSVDRSGQPPAKVTIVSEPDGADVYLDGTFVSSTPATLELPAGNYQVTVQLAGYQEWKRDLRVLGGSEITLRPRLEK